MHDIDSLAPAWLLGSSTGPPARVRRRPGSAACPGPGPPPVCRPASYAGLRPMSARVHSWNVFVPAGDVPLCSRFVSWFIPLD